MFIRSLFAAALLSVLLLPGTADAYVGPGAGLSLLGALWALLIALGTALLFLVAWPLRRMMKRRRAARQAEAPRPAEQQSYSQPPERHAERPAERPVTHQPGEPLHSPRR